MKMKISVFSLLFFVSVMPAFAGWEYDGYYIGDGSYYDDGSRFTIGFRGGLAMSRAKMKNEIGSLYTDYYMNENTGSIISSLSFFNSFGDPEPGSEDWPAGWIYVGEGDIATLPVKEDFNKNAFTAGFGLGFTLPNRPQWRLEISYDYIAETNYNQTPLLEGDMTVTDKDGVSRVIHAFSTGAKSTISTDVISAMVNYDFFDGKDKQLNKFIPYIGLGLGYAVSKTTLALTDTYADLSLESDLYNYGVPNASGILQFDNPVDKTKYPSSTNLAVLGVLGFSYGIAESTFIDTSFPLMYIPKITWDIVNSDGTKYREWFSAENMLYTNFMIGLRFEF